MLPMLVALTPGEINVKVEGEFGELFFPWIGSVEVTGDQVVMYTRAAVWEDVSRGSQKRKRKAGGARAHSRSEEYIRSITIRRSSSPARCRASVRQGKTAICECSAPKILNIPTRMI